MLLVQVLLARVLAGFFLRYIAVMSRRNFISALLSCVLWASHSPSVLASYEPIGMFIEPAPTGEIIDDSIVDYDRLIQHERRLLEARELEQRIGPYSSELAETWLELAHDAVDLGQGELASALFQKGLHNVRLNSGLTTDKQLTALTEWIAVLRRTQRQDALIQQLNYRYRITGYGAAPWDADRLTFALEYLDQQLAVLSVATWRREESQVIKFTNHLESLVDDACGGSNADDRACFELVKRRLHLLYLVSYAVQPIIEDSRLLPPHVQRDLNERTLSEEQLLSLHRNAYQAGVRVVEKGIDYLGTSNELELALADWRWFNGKTTQARKLYARLAHEQPVDFAVPVALPNGLVADYSKGSSGNKQKTATFSFDVTATGKVRKIVEEIDAGEQRSSSRLRRHLKRLKFRPVIDESGDRVTQRVTRTYVQTR